MISSGEQESVFFFGKLDLRNGREFFDQSLLFIHPSPLKIGGGAKGQTR